MALLGIPRFFPLTGSFGDDPRTRISRRDGIVPGMHA
jgi:hypothetical protein